MAYVGSDFRWSYISKRLEGARLVAAEHGLDFLELDLEPGGHEPGTEAAVAKNAVKWLKGLEAPFGVVAATDRTGFDLLTSCGLPTSECRSRRR